MPFSWDVLTNPPGFGTSTMLLLTDGRVICQEDGTANWSALTPDAQGSYKNGTWAPIAPMASWRRYYASAVLANGNVLVAGGEAAPTGDTNDCEIYDPVADSWTVIAPPGGWPNIGDAPCAVLDDGRVLVGNINTTQTVIYDPVANAWTGTAALDAVPDPVSGLLDKVASAGSRMGVLRAGGQLPAARSCRSGGLDSHAPAGPAGCRAGLGSSRVGLVAGRDEQADE
jgi:Kelch motif